MFYFYLFVPIFALFYFALRGFIRLDLKIALVVISFLCSSITLFIYKGLEGDENYKLINDKEILSRFIAKQSLNQEQDALEVDRIILTIASRDEVQAGEIYLLAKRLKSINENILASQAFEQLYRNFPNELDGGVLAEYAQTMFLKEERTFNSKIEAVLDEALLKSPNNPSALTLQGLKELENKNIDLTIKLWTKALNFLENERDISELKILIEAVKKLKNQ
jgi:cytochrome c-type biogenesis protein CcmH/NrfG